MGDVGIVDGYVEGYGVRKINKVTNYSRLLLLNNW